MRNLFLVAAVVAGLMPMRAAAQTAWQSVLPAIDPTRDAVAGVWKKADSGLTVAAATGARLMLPVAPRGEYDLRVEFTRQTGVHSIALIFVVGKGQATFEVDAWGEHLAGIQDINGRSIKENDSRREGIKLENEQRATLMVEVRKGLVRGLLNDRVVVAHRTDGSDLSIPALWRIPDGARLGIGAWESATTFHAIDVRAINGPRLELTRPAEPQTSKASVTPTTSPPAPREKSAPTNQGARGKRVLLVIANHHFFYREYADPRQEMERAGIRVTVAAGRKAPCRPHDGSGQGADGGIVQPDLALADVKSQDYDAILFAGGWGSSAYQFAFNGRYSDPAYNGDRAVKLVVNRLVKEFLEQDKYVCALCNAVSVLAWARIDGKSPLAGKRVCAPVRQAAAGIYNGRPAQPSCRWHPEVNGAILSPPGGIGQPGSAHDDVLVDGKIITGEDDISAREMGRRIVQVLSGK